MLFKLTVSLTPVNGGWAEDEERLVGCRYVEADTFQDALVQVQELAPEVIPDDVSSRDTGDLNRRTFR